jgi:hypothetical protein
MNRRRGKNWLSAYPQAMCVCGYRDTWDGFRKLTHSIRGQNIATKKISEEESDIDVAIEQLGL